MNTVPCTVEATEDHNGAAAFSVVFKCPACGTETRLGCMEWVHEGYPRRDDMHYLTWNIHCTGCHQWATAWMEQKLHRSYDIGSYSTRRRLVGPLLWEVHE